MRKLELTITADTNDGDYISEVSIITEDQLNYIMPAIKAIGEFKPYTGIGSGNSMFTHRYNYPNEDHSYRHDLGGLSVNELYSHVDSSVLATFDSYVPYGDYGIHSITSITVSDVPIRTELLRNQY